VFARKGLRRNHWTSYTEIKHDEPDVLRTLLTRSVWARTVVGIFFCVSGAFVTSVLSIGAPSFWHFLCGVLWTISGLVWIFRPSIAPALSLVPVLALALFAVRIVIHIRQEGTIVRLWCLCVFLTGADCYFFPVGHSPARPSAGNFFGSGSRGIWRGPTLDA
jgi:hypothetical protein